MDAILREIGLGTLSEKFKSERIDVPMIASLSDGDLIRLGVATIGDRHRIRRLSEASLKQANQTTENREGEQHASTGRPSSAREILLERSRLFGYARGTSNKQKGRGKRKSVRGVTHNFICLADKEQKCVPTTSEKEVLNNAGLGRKKIKLNRDDDEQTVIEKIMSSEMNTDTNETVGFPELREAGGFELLRSSQNCRDLKIIDCDWNAKELQKNVNTQSTIYIRPIQKNLPTKNKKLNQEPSNAVKAVCERCKVEYPIMQLREHVDICYGELEEILPSLTEAESVYVDAAITQTSPIPVNELDFIEISHTSSNVVPVSQVDAPPLSESHVMVIEPIQEVEVHVPVISTEHTISDTINQIVTFCKLNNITDPVEILKKLQHEILRGRPLDIEDVTQANEGETSYIMVDRNQLLETAFDEIRAIPPSNLSLTLEVQFYNEVAADYGGPRKEFFRLILIEIQQKYFEHGLRVVLAKEYETVGKIFALSILQNGKIPRMMSEDILRELFADSTEPSNPCISELRKGLNSLGIYELCRQMPSFVFLFHPTTVTLTFRRITTLLRAEFDTEGTNKNALERNAYSAFLRYLREVASGRRENLCLGSILQFISGTDEEPVLGFKIQPSIRFVEVDQSYIPTANTCINCLTLPRARVGTDSNLPDDQELFSLYDYAFCNNFYGLQ